MILIGDEILDEFCKKYRDATKAIKSWRTVVRNSYWKKLQDVNDTLPKTDKVGRCYVFDICGNKYRLIAKIVFEKGLVSVCCAMTHQQYDRGRWKKTYGCLK